MKRIYKISFIVRSKREYNLETRHEDKFVAAENIPDLMTDAAQNQILDNFRLRRNPFGQNHARGDELIFLSIAEQTPILVIQ